MIDIEIKDLKYVSAIAKYESISQAANELYITQPSLSGYLKNLENRMGLPLFQRIGKRMVLTYFGECFLKEGNDLLLRHKHFSEELDRVLYEKRGRLSIGFPILRGISLLPVTLPRFSEEFPNVEILCYEEDASTLDRLIQQGELDIGFFNCPINNENIDYQIISNEEIVLSTSKNDPLIAHAVNRPGCKYPWLDLKLCKDRKFILNYPEQRTSQIAEYLFHQAGFSPKVALRIRSLMTTVSLSAQGYGLAFSSEKYPNELCFGEKPYVLSIGEPVTVMNLIAGYRKGIQPSFYAQKFIDIAKETY